jgi:eukaryotic-like serine/threonine-protein kinase
VTSSDDKTLVATSADVTGRTARTALEVSGYAIGEVLGRGGMGEVVLAHDGQMDREVALKRMRGAAPDADAIERFIREAKIQARLDHPAIVPVHQLGYDDAGLPYFTMKRLVGTTLLTRIEQQGPIQPLLRALVDVCFAIELAHTRGVVHRDLKPSNIMLGDYGEVYVIDWGVARLVGGSRSEASPSHPSIDTSPPQATAAGALLGTPGYMAPEQVRGEEVQPPADVYALGAILFEILVGEPLHPRGTAALVSTLQDAAVCSPVARAPGRTIAPELDAACVAALAADPAARPTARELATRVQAYLDGDRDLDRRRALAAEQLAIARAAVAADDRPSAIRAAGRALALDPASEAVELVTSLIVAPPDKIPVEVTRELAQGEVGLALDRGTRGSFAYLGIWLLLPMVALLHVSSWPQLIALVGFGTLMAAFVTLHGRGKFPTWLLILCNVAYAVLFSRLSSPFVFSPLLACTIAIAVGAHAGAGDRRLLAYTLVAVMIALPIVLELTGVLAHTWWMTSEGLTTRGTVFDGRGSSDLFGVAVGTIALAMVVTGYALAMNRAREAAQRTVQIQAWHLKQLLPPDSKG